LVAAAGVVATIMASMELFITDGEDVVVVVELLCP
jgi:hypothetical protein